ncbi:hypothetical protein F5148DRAFT_1146569 [Russula earlei]|uniref:Uncharacterized protein n=1 Tax=Russula earlei TaxID=71964 RepID=A0ACC0UJE8_9AGAM|nr:hypothetical protein F5148DRAFT_1146569 [Russula earlei]
MWKENQIEQQATTHETEIAVAAQNKNTTFFLQSVESMVNAQGQKQKNHIWFHAAYGPKPHTLEHTPQQHEQHALFAPNTERMKHNTNPQHPMPNYQAAQDTAHLGADAITKVVMKATVPFVMQVDTLEKLSKPLLINRTTGSGCNTSTQPQPPPATTPTPALQQMVQVSYQKKTKGTNKGAHTMGIAPTMSIITLATYTMIAATTAVDTNKPPGPKPRTCNMPTVTEVTALHSGRHNDGQVEQSIQARAAAE